MKISRNALLAAAFVIGTGTAVYAAEGQTPAGQTPAAQQGMKSTAPTTGSGAMKDPSTTKAADPQKKSMDDPKQYGHPDKH